ncbi:MAG: HEAT repeat domain-containing protein [Acidobacteriota bacterium]|nr:HEAT repeat domain-containing protein [Acidobacteriota bacterium]
MNAEEKLVKECLERAIAEFQTNPLSPRIMRRFAADAPGVFAPVAVSMLLTANETAGFRYLAMLLVKQPTLFRQLSNPVLFTRPQAVILSRRLMSVDPSLDVRFARQLPARNGSTNDTLAGQAAERALDILDEISLGKRMVPILSHLSRHPDFKISSKATLLIGKRVQNVAFAKRLMAESEDPRVRANAVEAVWGNRSPSIQELFWDCVEDKHNRVVGNAIVGLYLAGEERATEVVCRFAHDHKAEFRMTSAWTMGRMGNSDFIPTLSPLIKDDHPGVRSAALRSLQNIRQVEKVRRPSETDLAVELPANTDFAFPDVPDVAVEPRAGGSPYAADKKRFRRYAEW